VQTCWPFVGAGCPWVESGIGVVVARGLTERGRLARAGSCALAAASAANARWPEFIRRFAASGAQPELAEPAARLLEDSAAGGS
jgi:hypothetical protein